MRLRKTAHLTQVSRVREVYKRGDDREGILPETSAMEASAARVEIGRRCPVCSAVCEDAEGKICPTQEQFPEIHHNAAAVLQKLRTERSRPIIEILKRQVEGLRSRMMQGRSGGILS